jgi:hypothetical protein
MILRYLLLLKRRNYIFRHQPIYNYQILSFKIIIGETYIYL